MTKLFEKPLQDMTPKEKKEHLELIKQAARFTSKPTMLQYHLRKWLGILPKDGNDKYPLV